jgi:hypothetical protein
MSGLGYMTALLGCINDMINYIVNYAPGCSGRFLTAVVFKLANKIDTPIVITPENSGHSEEENGIVTGYYPLKKYSSLTSLAYLELTKMNTGNIVPVYTTHMFPAFNLIEKRGDEFNETKFINISYEEDDVDELLANTIIKFSLPHINTLLVDNSKKHHPQFFGVNYLLIKFKKLYGYEITLDNLFDIDIIKKLCSIEYNRQIKHAWTEVIKFKHPIDIPDKFKDRNLIIKYKDIFTKTKTSYTALEQLSDFTGMSITPNVYESYHTYVSNQPIMLNKYAPWLTK